MILSLFRYNSFDNNGHALGSVSSAAPRSLSWQISTGDNTNNEMEVWYGGSRRLDVTLVTPSGARLGPVALGQTQDIKNSQGMRVGRIIHRRNDPNNGDNQIDILLDRTLSKGLWRVELTTSETAPIPFHAWIERDDFGQSTFGPSDVVPSHTLGSISCGPRTLVVGSYNARVPQRDLSFFSAEGPTRDGRQKPEISAPGHGVRAANALGNTVSMSGTSMAAPHVAGLVALLFQAAGRMLTVGEIRSAVMDIARRNPPGGSGWHSRYGMGRIDGVAALRGFVETGSGAALVQALPAAVTGNGNGHPDALSQLLASIIAGAGSARVRVAIEVEPLGR